MIVLLLLSLISSIILAAVLLSTLAKASSRTTIGESTRSALPSAVLCLCPPLNVIPLSPTIVLNLCGKLLISSINPAFVALSLTKYLDAFGSPKLRFSEIVEVNKNASCGTIVIFFLRSLNFKDFTSISSKNNWLSGISIVRPRDFASVVFPQPTGPTIAMSSPG